jgi:hypothetical protein
MSENKFTLKDLESSESEVLKRIADDLNGGQVRNMAGHNSSTTGHKSGSTHSSHNSGVSNVKPEK